MRDAERLAFARRDGCLVGVGAFERPKLSYRIKVEGNSGASLDADPLQMPPNANVDRWSCRQLELAVPPLLDKNFSAIGARRAAERYSKDKEGVFIVHHFRIM